jgi:hypothetical protein
MIALLCCIGGGLMLAPPASAADPFFGLFSTNMSNPAAQMAADMNAQAGTGVGTLREHLHWDRIERYPGVFDWAETDALFAAAWARGMTVLPVLVDTPAFYSTRPDGQTNGGWPPRDPVYIKRFTTELTKRYGSRGTYFGCLLPGFLCRRPYKPITAWQVWNEPDILAWWRTGVDAGAYTALLRQAYEGLKAGDAKAEVVLAGLTVRVVERGGYLDQLYDRGAAPYFDTLAIHPYAGSVGGTVYHLRTIRQIATDHGDGAVPIRVTEYGYATGGTQTWVVDAQCQAALIQAATRELSARRAELGLRSIVQFQWQDRSTNPLVSWPNHAGLLWFDGSAKPALAAFTDAVLNRPPGPNLAVTQVCPERHWG